jgi:transposase
MNSPHDCGRLTSPPIRCARLCTTFGRIQELRLLSGYTVGDVKSFKNARQVSAWLGRVPRHEGTGGKASLGRISKRGDVYLRTMLIHGARTVIAQLERKRDAPDGWLRKLVARRNKNIAAVALAAKNARIAWAVLAHERTYQHDYVATHAAGA